MNKQVDDSLLRISPKGWHWVGSTWAKLAGLVGVGGAAAAGLTYLYASQIEPRWIAFPTHQIKLRGLPPAFDGYRIVQISDLHLCEGRVLNPDRVGRIVRQVNDKRPDLILITGDFVSALDATSREGIARLNRLQAQDGVFAIPGNHDYWCGIDDVVAAVKPTGIRLLCNAHTVVPRRGDALVIAGVDDVWEGKPDLNAALRGAPADAPVILMAHEPNFAPAAAEDGRVALQLSGHSHGGQVRIPGLGPLALPDQAWRYPMGFYQVGDMQLYVSRGVGMAEIPFRLNCRPEVTLFILRA